MNRETQESQDSSTLPRKILPSCVLQILLQRIDNFEDKLSVLKKSFKKPLQYCKVISLQLIKINEKKKKSFKIKLYST